MLRRILILWWCGAAALQGQDAKELVRRMIETELAHFDDTFRYRAIQRIETHKLDTNGATLSTEANTYDVFILDGFPYRKLIAHNGRPLTPGMQQREEQKLERARRQRASDPSARRDYDAERERQRALLRQVPSAYEFRLVGQEPIQGHASYLIEAKPDPHFHAADFRTRLLAHMKGRVWIDKAEMRAVRAEAEVIDTVSYGGFLARLDPGSRLDIELERIAPGVWQPARLHVRFTARIALIKKLFEDVTLLFENYRPM